LLSNSRDKHLSIEFERIFAVACQKAFFTPAQKKTNNEIKIVNHVPVGAGGVRGALAAAGAG
jgi:hypothetical protein